MNITMNNLPLITKAVTNFASQHYVALGVFALVTFVAFKVINNKNQLVNENKTKESTITDLKKQINGLQNKLDHADALISDLETEKTKLQRKFIEFTDTPKPSVSIDRGQFLTLLSNPGNYGYETKD